MTASCCLPYFLTGVGRVAIMVYVTAQQDSQFLTIYWSLSAAANLVHFGAVCLKTAGEGGEKALLNQFLEGLFFFPNIFIFQLCIVLFVSFQKVRTV